MTFIIKRNSIWYFSKVNEPSEHDGANYRTLGATQVDCVGVNQPFQKKTPLRGRITERPIWIHIIWCRILFWIRICGLKILRPRILEKIDIWKFAWADSEKFCGQKNRRKILSHNIRVSYMCELYVSHKWRFFKNEPWLITDDHTWFSRSWKADMGQFLTGIMMKYKKFAIIRFWIRQTKMAFETPFVPRGLHFKLGPSGV